MNGARKKLQLDPHRVAAIKETVFDLYPLEAGETEKVEWAKAVLAIDEANRRLNRSKK